jgi:hypothetical protein
VVPQNAGEPGGVGQRHPDQPLEPPGPQDRRIQMCGAVAGAQHHDALARQGAVQQL